jgi:DNA-binding XRE family transcriptional regulator
MNIKKVKLTSFDEVLKKELKDPEFARQFEIEKKKLEMANKISALRKKKKYSQATLAKKIGIKQSIIGRIESGNQNLTLETMQKIAIALNSELKVSFK